MTAVVLRGDAAHLPLPDGSVDLIACSPPYFGQRDYRDGGESLEGQIGSEERPAEYIAALLRCTAEWMRVLKPGGSIFVDLGDKYSTYTGANWGNGRSLDGYRAQARYRHRPQHGLLPPSPLADIGPRRAGPCSRRSQAPAGPRRPGEPVRPPGGRIVSTDDLAARLEAILRDLDGYVERRAAELAAPMIAEAETRAEERVAEAQAETQRQEDLVAELRRHLKARDRQVSHLREITEGKAGDFIVRFDEVRPGDRLADERDTELVTVLRTDAYSDHLGISVQRGNGRTFYLDCQPDSLTAVRRSAA